MKVALYTVFFVSNTYVNVVAKNENDAIKAAEEIAEKLGYADVAEEVEMIDYIFEYDIVYYDINQNECVLPAYRKFN